MVFNHDEVEIDEGYCFVCSNKNRAELRVGFYFDGEEACGEFLPDNCWEGYPGVVHGGILTALLDEVMYKAVFAEGEITVTAGIEVRFRSLALPCIPLFLKGRAGEKKDRLSFIVR